MSRLLGVIVAIGLVLALGPGPAVGEAQEALTTDPLFSCISDGTKVRHTYLRNADPAKLKEAVRIFENNVENVEYPVGTLLQAIPGEAMVKRSHADFPNTNGWEYFLLGVSAQGTTIRARGDQAANRLGTCASCHQAAAKFDYVCERTHGCAPVPLTDVQIATIQAADARCPK